jgi:hypothetical protein
MELQELQNNWESQFNENENQKKLVVDLYKESKQNKVKSKLRKLVVYNILFMIYNLIVVILTWSFIANYFPNPGVLLPGATLLILSFIAFYMNVFQLNDISKIKLDNPVVELQKTIEKLKIKRIKHNRFIFIFSYIYFWLMVVLIFNFNLFTLISTVWQNAALVVVFHVTFSILWFPIAFWLLKKYDMPDEKSKFWSKLKKDSFLTDQSVNFSLNDAQIFLQDIEVFEKS